MSHSYLILAVAVAAQTPSVQAQDVGRVQLAEPKTAFHEPFSQVTGVRELTDGSLIVADRLEQAIRIIDFRAGTMDDIGHVGGGPGEFQMPGGIFPLPGDSTLLLDYGNLRLSVIAPDGRIPHSTAMLTPEGSLISPRGVDAAGHIYFDQGGLRIGPDGDVETSRRAPILRMTWEAETFDTVAYLPLPEPSGSSRSFSTGGGQVRIQGLSPLPKSATWAVAPDGSVAVVHADPYRVEWYDPQRSSLQGPIVPYVPVPITDEDKEAWANRMGGGNMVMIAAGGGGGGGGRSGSQTIQMPRPEPDDMEWPDVKPPFPVNAARVTPDGALWVQRHVAYGQPQLFDVFDRAGVRIRQVELPPGREIVGFGVGVVYVVNVDEDDLQWLEAYEL
jgi:hypothetical protein